MATEDQQQEQQEDEQPELIELPEGDPEARIKALEAANARLKAARETVSREAEKHRKELRDLKRSQAGQPSPEELQRERDEAIRERDEARAGRVKDRQDLAIARHAGKYLDPEFHDLAPDLIDRSLLEVDDDGQILSGLDKAFQDLVRKRPKVALQKKPDGGTGQPRRPDQGNGKAAGDPIAAAFAGKTSFGT
jgi:hypothetical protein